ncbi:penicillin acylase family protein [Rhodoferax sp.]|uniref:penicillin acylase family protein n=1 Tax=Rhodoferax sp. TaxID=50421 RepID=UPI00262042A5|nr:penicillin acylase family protein [Rhodoferax sp.]MDD2924064.1 penicillin acylase family protein [Rhodoferax sp.]
MKSNPQPVDLGHDVEVRYTPLGVAHIHARDYHGAGFGYGWALARDNLASVVERMVTIAGERSRAMPADGSYFDVFAGSDIRNVDSDAAYRYLLPASVIERTKAGASAQVQALVRGYVRGFNHHVNSAPLPGESCRACAWFREITEDDVWRRIAHFPILETSLIMLREMLAASPPASVAAVAAPTDTALRLAEFQTLRGGSNSAAFGRDMVEGGVGGISFSNPHYFWHGTERLHAFHLIVDGELNVFGSTAYGLPFPLMGFNEHVGWGLTHANDKRSTLYELKLDPSDPTRYQIGDQIEAMRPVTVEVETLAGPVRRVFWETRYGPIVKGQYLPWNEQLAYAFADPNLGNNRFADQFLDISRARSVREIRDSQFKYQGSPWSHITAADTTGEVYYSNISVVANITDAQLERCLVTSPARAYMDLTDATVLNGSDPAAAWTRDVREVQPGILPPADKPWMIRTDMTFNSNDSHWVASVTSESRLEGYARVIGSEHTARGERTRVAALYMQQIKQGSAVTGSPGATPHKWERLFFSSRNLMAELILDDVLADCQANPLIQMTQMLVQCGVHRPQAHHAPPAVGMPDVMDLTPACQALAAWDRADTLQSCGSALFAEFISELEVTPTVDLVLASRYWRVPFSVQDPIHTPRGFLPSEETRQALARALWRFQSAQVPINAPLSEVRSVTRAGCRLPISGSYFGYHLTRPSQFTPGQGVTELRNGDGYMHIVSLKPGRVEGRFLVTFSQSTNPQSPHYADMTEVYSRESLADIVFYDTDISAAQIGETVILNSQKN